MRDPALSAPVCSLCTLIAWAAVGASELPIAHILRLAALLLTQVRRTRVKCGSSAESRPRDRVAHARVHVGMHMGSHL